MTPAINCAKRVGINFNIHEYDHDPTADSYGEEAVLKMGLDSGIVFKTLIVTTSDKQLLVAILPVAKQLNLKRFAKAVGMKKVVMAEKKSIENTTGYIPGGISPIGQKKQLSTVIDQSATQLEMIYVSAGRRGLQIELSPNDLIALTDGKFEKICD
mgnify:FL=1